jgi:sec-independent protein translocase protein TatC
VPGYLWAFPAGLAKVSDTTEMTFLEHLEELRWTLVRSAIAVGLAMVAAFIAKGLVFDRIVLAPRSPDFLTYRALCALGRKLGLSDAMCASVPAFGLQNINISGQFFTHLMVSFVAGIIVGMPYLLWELWRFVSPGLHPQERRSMRGVVFFASLLFFAGVAFGYFVLAPLSVQFFGTYQVSEAVQNTIALDSYISMVTSVTLWTGLLFQLPLVVLFLARTGLVGPAMLRAYRRHAFVTVLVLSAIVTPPDIISQLIVSGPLMVLYEASIVLAARAERRRERMMQAGQRAVATRNP